MLQLLALLWTAGAVAACQMPVLNGKMLRAPLALTQTDELPVEPATTLALPPNGLSPKLIALSQDHLPKFTTTRRSQPGMPGTYLVYGEGSPEQARDILYVSTDAVVGGTLFKYSPIDDWLPVPFMTGSDDPHFIFTDYREGELTLRDGKLDIWATDAAGNSLKNWHGEMINGPDTNCSGPSFSPNGRWVIIVCNSDYVYYVVLLNPSTGEQRLIPMPGGANTPQPEDWSGDESQFYVWDNTYKYCFVSIKQYSAKCRDLGQQLLSISPDWTWAVLRDSDMPLTAEGNLPGAQIILVDISCVLLQQYCDEGIRFALPFYKATGGDVYSALRLDWESSGRGFAWMSVPYVNTFPYDLKNFASGWIDLTTKSNQILWQGPEKNMKFWGTSPDGKWLVFSDQDGLLLGSPEGRVLRRMVRSKYEINFYGWLIVQ
jgi:hypothetical protein